VLRAIANSLASLIVGTQTNDSAAAGFLGEVISSTVGSGSAVALSTGTGANVTSISLTAGDWDVFGNVAFLPAASTSITAIAGAINTTTASIGSFINQGAQLFFSAVVPGVNVLTMTPPQQRLLIASTTTVFLVAQANFSVAGLSAYGGIYARRRR